MAGGCRCGQSLEIPECSRKSETVFLCSATAGFFGWSGVEYSNAYVGGDHSDGAGAGGPYSRCESRALRSHQPARADGSVDVAAARCGDTSGNPWRIGVIAGDGWVVCGDVVYDLAGHAGIRIAHGTGSGGVDFVAAGLVTWLGFDRGWRASWDWGGARNDSAIGELAVPGESA